jgi:hypothetical protein
VQATPVHWTLQGASFSDGSTLTGGFSYDADTNTYSNLNIVVSGGTTFPHGITFTHVGGAAYLANWEFQAIPAASTIGDGSAIGKPYLYLDFVSAMTDKGGTISISSYYDGVAGCGNAYCTSAAAPFDQLHWNPGYGSISSIPEPVSITLLGGGLLGLMAVRRRQETSGDTAVASKLRTSRHA